MISINSGVLATYTFNALGQMAQAVYLNPFSHNYDTYGSLWTPDGDEMETCAETSDNSGCQDASFVKLHGRNLGYYDSSGSWFDHVNNLGSTSIVTAHDGSVSDDTTWYPFGEVWGSLTGSNDWHFAGMQDADCCYLWPTYHYPTPNRRYNPSLYRWLTPDPDNAGAEPSDPQTWNMYAYVGNNPTSRTDPDGTDYEVCTNDEDGNQTCTRVTDDTAFQQALKDPGAGISTKGDNASGDIYGTDSNGNQVLGGDVPVGSATRSRSYR